MRRAGAVALTGLAAGCTLENGAGPSVNGTTEFGLSVTMSASPDQVPRDGVTQSIVTMTVRDDSSRPVGGRRFVLSSTAGTLSLSEVTTGSDGRATFAFTAPSPGTVGNSAVVSAVPVGDNGANAVARLVSINFIGPSNTTAPTPSFVLSPESPERSAPIRFDASGSTDEGQPCVCSYSWDFGDGSVGSGSVVTHTYSSAGTYLVTLTATDQAGTSASLARAVTVRDVPAPTVTLVVAPNPPIAGQLATFTATVSVAPGHSIKSYSWAFGDGSNQTTSSPTTTKSFNQPGTYVATVTATDDLGQSGSASISFTIGSAVTANITFSPAAPAPATAVIFSGAGSTTSGGATISSWEWDFGDGNTASGVSATNTYAAAGSYVVRLTVTDSRGLTGTTTTSVTVK
jgi:PKD repeat protein